jgi:hypothetical protein
MTHLSSQEIFKAFDTALEVSSRWPRLLLALGFNPRLALPGPRAINNALAVRGFRPVVDEEDSLQTLLADYPVKWWFAIAQETAGRSDATVRQVTDAVRARTAQHAAQ